MIFDGEHASGGGAVGGWGRGGHISSHSLCVCDSQVTQQLLLSSFMPTSKELPNKNSYIVAPLITHSILMQYD